MSGGYCIMRLGAPHEGHVGLVARMLKVCRGARKLVLVGSSDKTGRPDVPLPWELRRDILRALLQARGLDAADLLVAPLPEIPIDGFTHQWFDHVIGACQAFAGEPLQHYFFGSDYPLECFDLLRERMPEVRLHRVPRIGSKSGTELRRAIVAREPALLRKYAFELAHYPPDAVERIASASRAEPNGRNS